jgi:hypothetical protein
MESGDVSYGVEVVADRRRFFKVDKRIAQSLLILPAAAPDQIGAAIQLRQGWNGPWTTIDHIESVRKYFWHDKSRLGIHVRILFLNITH